MPSVNDYADLLGVLANQGFAIDPNACISIRNRNVECGKCASGCVSGCIQKESRRILIDPTSCIRCGSCATACPTGAIAIKNPSDQQLLEEAARVLHRNGNTVVFACTPIMEKAKGRIDATTLIQCPCLGRIDESLLGACARMETMRIVLVTDDCTTCEYSKAARLIQQVVTCTRSLFSAWNIPCRIKTNTAKFPRLCAAEENEQYDCQRRKFFQDVRDGLKSSGMETASFMIDRSLNVKTETPEFEHVTDDGTLPHRIPYRRALLLNTLEPSPEQQPTPENDAAKDGSSTPLASENANSGAAEALMPQTTENEGHGNAAAYGDDAAALPHDGATVCGRLFRRVEIDRQACNGCLMCAVFCPTAALSKRIEYDEAAEAATAKLYRAPGNPRAQAASSKSNDTEADSTVHTRVKRRRRQTGSSCFATGEDVSLMYAPRLCVNCGSCMQLCPQHAISLHEGINAATLDSGYAETIPVKDVFVEKGGPDAIRNSMSKLINSPYIWG